MNFGKSSIGHLYREIYSGNPLMEEKLVSETIEKNIQNQIRALKLDLKLYEQELEDPKNLDKDATRAKIEKTKAEIKSLESTEQPPANTLLLNGLQNNIDDIDRQLEREKDLDKRELLKARQREYLDILKARQKPVTNADELNDAVDQIQSDQRLLDALSDNKIDEVDLYLFATSDMLAFIDYEFGGAIKIATGQMITNDSAKVVTSKTKEEIFEEADREWLKFKKETQQTIQELESERNEILSKIPKSNTQERQRYRLRLSEIEGALHHCQAELSDERSAWSHRQRTLTEIGLSSNDILGSVKLETLDKVKLLITEVQGIRAERVQTYLSEELEKLEDQFSRIKRKKFFSPETVANIEAELTEAKEEISKERISNPKVLRKLADNFSNAKKRLATSASELKAARENRPELEKQVQADYAEMKAVLENLSPEKIQELKKHYLEELRQKGISENSKIAQKGLRGIETLAGENVTIEIRDDKTREVSKRVQKNAVMTEFEARLKNISEMSPEELLLLSQDLNTFKQKIDHLKNLNADLEEALSTENQDAKLAHQTIQELERAETPEDIRHILDTNLGAEHLEYLPHAAFKKESEGVTEGYMMLRERGGQWMVVIDESAFADQKALKKLKMQVTHELLHVEFEKSERIQKRVREELVEADPKKWKAIRETYLEMAWEDPKKYPPGWTEADSQIRPKSKFKERFDELWTDNNILSELFAMQSEMGRTWATGNSAKERLNNLLTGIGAAAAMGDITAKTLNYKEGAKVTAENIKRGYEEGIEEGTKVPADVGRLSLEQTAGMTKTQAVFETNKERVDQIRKRIDEIKKSEYIGKVPGASELIAAIADYNESTNGLNDDLKKDPTSEVLASAVTERVETMEKDLTDVEDKIGKAARKAPNTEMGLMRRLWVNTSFLCMQDFVQAGIDAYEFFSRRHKRKVADHAAKLGMALFSGTDLGREARARQQKAEMEEVNEWKSRYENMDAWQLINEMKGIANSIAPNQDQLKAILRILADKGRIDWRDENLWTVLNKLQSAVVLKPGDQLLLHNPILLRQRLHTALGEIYDYDEFPNLERTNESSYQSSKGKYDTLHSRMQDKLTGRLDELLAQHKAGEQVDPILYESIMEYCIKKGKSYAENVMFHLIAGMATGLLAPDRGLALGDHLNTWPAVDWFSTFSPPMSQADWKKLCMDYFPKDFLRGSITATGCGDDFKNFFWTTIQNNNRVVERVKKSVSERGWDHDWGRSIACLGDSNTAKRFLSGRSGQEETKTTAVGNAYVGAVQWLEENSRNPQFANKKNFARIAGWIAMSEGMLDGSAFKESSKDINTRANDAMNKDVPRESGVGHHKGENLQFHRDMAKSFLLEIDRPFFEIITGHEARSKEIKEQMAIQAREHLQKYYPALTPQIADIEDIDQIYERIDLIIGAMFDTIDEAKFQRILNNIASRISVKK